MAEGEGIEPLTLRLPRFSGPVADLSAAPSYLAEGASIELARLFSSRLPLSKRTHYRSATPPMIDDELRDDIVVSGLHWLRRSDLNRRSSGYGPDEIPLLHATKGQ